MPVRDWQFWVVTAFALIALAYLLRRFIPHRLRPWSRTPGQRQATLTISAAKKDGAPTPTPDAVSHVKPNSRTPGVARASELPSSSASP